MKAALINGSPKGKASISERLLQAMRERLGGEQEYVFLQVNASDQTQAFDNLKDCNALVFAFPLYIDGIPSRLLRFLDEIKDEIAVIAPGAMVWAIVNNGFYEGHQNALALDMMQSFCVAGGLSFGQGVGVGAGGMASAAPVGSGPMRNLGLALDQLAQNIHQSRIVPNQFVVPNFPRFLYKAGGNWSWKAEARKNGLKAKSLHAKRV